MPPASLTASGATTREKTRQVLLAQEADLKEDAWPMLILGQPLNNEIFIFMGVENTAG